MRDLDTQLRAALAGAIAASPRWLFQALAEGNNPMRFGACQEVVIRLMRAMEPWEVKPRRVCPYTGNVLPVPAADEPELPLPARSAAAAAAG